MTTALLSPPAAGIARLIRRGLAWWLGELAQMMPRRLAGLFGRKGDGGPLLKIGAEEMTLLWPDNGRSSPIFVPLTGCSDEERRARLRSALRGSSTGSAVRIGLDGTLLFEASIELPLSAQPSLRQILQHQVERLLPLDASSTCFDYRVQPRLAGAEMLKVRLFVAKTATIDRALDMARRAGLSPERVVAADYHGDGGPPVLWQARSAADLHRHLRRRLELAAVVLALAGYALYIHRLDRVRDELETRLAAANAAASAVVTLGEQARRAELAASFFERRRKEAAPLQVLDALTRMVPTDSWVTRLTMRSRAVEITGYSTHASNLVARAESSGSFVNPQFRSPITLTPDAKLERFELGLEVKPEPGR